ncbi:maltoporin [Pseudomonas oryzihabitans]|uniref:maltoporin n=1 Tax=Pseudomonas oryzihabitans TaxID=47885 RepID=UPI001F111289|nr:carbohydrate porin [Pseudomonas psychrotolerans]MDR6678831.1 maltoporin [Pseudomonas psychrotolerans]
MSKKKAIPFARVSAASLLGTLLLAPTVHAFETTGYFRAGLGDSSGRDSMRCFKLQGAQSKYRLGNECEQYGEFAAKQDVLTLDDGSAVGVYGMASLNNRYDRTPTFHGDNGEIRMPQAYAYWNNIAALNGGNLWAGRRYYKRNDIHISDFFYWNQSATGGGIEDVNIGGLKYSLAFSRKDNQNQKDFQNRYDFNVAGFNTNPNGSLEIGVSYLDKPTNQPNANSGVAVTLQHKQANFMGWGGVNTFAVQRGQGPGTALGSTGDPTLSSADVSYRVVDFFDWQISRYWGGQVAAVYQKDKRPNGNDLRWTSLGGRLVYGINDQFKFSTELGHDQVEAPGGTRKLTKLTLAPTWSPKGPEFKTRPEFRLFYTYAVWNRAAQNAADQFDPGSALSSTGTFGSDLHGSNIGFQVEQWW